MHKIWENRPEALQEGESGENTSMPHRYGEVGGARAAIEAGETQDFTRTGRIIKQAALKTEGQSLWVCRVFPGATLRISGSASMLN